MGGLFGVKQIKNRDKVAISVNIAHIYKYRHWSILGTGNIVISNQIDFATLAEFLLILCNMLLKNNKVPCFPDKKDQLLPTWLNSGQWSMKVVWRDTQGPTCAVHEKDTVWRSDNPRDHWVGHHVQSPPVANSRYTSFHCTDSAGHTVHVWNAGTCGVHCDCGQLYHSHISGSSRRQYRPQSIEAGSTHCSNQSHAVGSGWCSNCCPQFSRRLHRSDSTMARHENCFSCGCPSGFFPGSWHCHGAGCDGGDGAPIPFDAPFDGALSSLALLGPLAGVGSSVVISSLWRTPAVSAISGMRHSSRHWLAVHLLGKCRIQKHL